MFFLAGVRVDPSVVCAHSKRVRDALRMADISLEKACQYMDIDKGQFSRQLAGDGHLSFLRLMLLPEEFWRYFYFLGASDIGIPAAFMRGMQVAMALKELNEAPVDALVEQLTDRISA